jgi:integrase
VSGRTRAEVVEQLRRLRQQVDSGIVPDHRPTVQDFLDRWLTVNLPGTAAEATEDSYVDTVRLHLVPALGRKQLAKLTVADLDKLWKAKRTRAIAPTASGSCGQCSAGLSARLNARES